uniref:Eye-specific diacylglycerol kinase n=1 Tax=Anopheles culicifacies TaxID=139723 RepID=A0A182LTI0_9DIPT
MKKVMKNPSPILILSYQVHDRCDESTFHGGVEKINVNQGALIVAACQQTSSQQQQWCLGRRWEESHIAGAHRSLAITGCLISTNSQQCSSATPSPASRCIACATPSPDPGRPRVRSASFDEIQLEAQRSSQQRSLSVAATASADESTMAGGSGVGSLLLQVPQTTPGQRSRSFDLAGSASDEGSAVAAAFLDVPKRFQRRKSSSKTPPPCIHCLYLEEYRRLIGVEQRLYYDSEEYQAYVDYTSSSCSSGDDDDDGDVTDAGEAGNNESEPQTAAAAAAVSGVEEDLLEGAVGGTRRVSPRRRPRVDCEDASSSNVLLSPPAVASPCRITLTLSPTKPDDDEHCVDYAHGSTLEPARLSEIALMLPGEDEATSSGLESKEPVPASTSSTSDAQPEATGDAVEPSPSNRTRRRSISRQEAIIVEPTGSSLENVSNASDSRPTSPPRSRPIPDIQTGGEESDNQQPPQRGRAASMGPIIPSTASSSSPPPSPLPAFPCYQPPVPSLPPRLPLESPPPSAGITVQPSQPGDFVRDIYLQVPDLKRDRAASVDSCFTKVTGAKTEELQPPPDGACLNLLAVPSSGAVRSRSVDIVLPTEEQARYKALALAGPSGVASGAAPGTSGSGATGSHHAPGVRGFMCLCDAAEKLSV